MDGVNVEYFYPRPPGWRATNSGTVKDGQTPISIHALRGGGRPASRSINRIRTRYFYPRPPGGGRQVTPLVVLRRLRISIHALRVEGDKAYLHGFSFWWVISIHALRVEGDPIIENAGRTLMISIHALRVEGDFWVLGISTATHDFYPRPPGGGRQNELSRKVDISPFLSTPSGWRATCDKKRRKP